MRSAASAHPCASDYSHRKSWVLERIAFLASMFAIDVCAYAVMSNHYHLVLRVDRTRALQWTREEVVAQWTRLFRTPRLVERWLNGQVWRRILDSHHLVASARLSKSVGVPLPVYR